MTCKAYRRGQQYFCDQCGTTWDHDDNDPPDCQHEALAKDLMLYGSCFIKDGKRVPPEEVILYDDPPDCNPDPIAVLVDMMEPHQSRVDKAAEKALKDMHDILKGEDD